MAEDYEYFEKKKPNKIYISKEFPSESPSDEERPLRFISRVVDGEDIDEVCEVKGEYSIRVTPKQREEIKALFYVDTREVKRITFQRYTNRTGKPHKNTSLSFSGASVRKIYELLQIVQSLDLRKNDEKIRFDENILLDFLSDFSNRKNFLKRNLNLVIDIAENDITESDIVALGYRKKQLRVFENLLSDKTFFTTKQREWGKTGIEPVWQYFFEQNPWIFGYGLNYIINSNLTDRKLEQVISGYAFNQSGKRVDALLKTNGLINSLCFLEIKTHETKLLHDKPYRSECWQISSDLAGSISQIQKTVQKALINIRTKTETTGPSGELLGNEVYLYQPKAYVVIGSLDEFIGDNGVNEQKFSSFELYRRNLSNPEIITYDELYERAKFIVSNSETITK